MDQIKNDRTFCCVPQCNSQGTRNPELSFHQFPRDTSKISLKSLHGTKVLVPRKKEWLRVLKIGKKLSNRAKVSSKHFVPEDYRTPANMSQRLHLRPTAVPSCFLPVGSHQKTNEQRFAKRQALYEKLNRDKEMDINTEEEKDAKAADSNDLREEEIASTRDPETIQLDPETGEECLQFEMDDPNVSREKLAIEALIELSISHPNTTDKGTQVVSGDLKLSYIIKSSELSQQQLRKLTGIASLKLFDKLCEYVNEELKINNRHFLPLKERIILVFMKLKLNLSFECLSIFFGCSERTVSDIFSTLVPVISSILESDVEFVPKEEILDNLPIYFREFPDVRIVLDCTEILIQKPKCLTERISTYSNYYGDQTIKYMIGTSPGGLFTFLSKGYGGRTADRHIFKESGLIEMLEPFTDAIMVDKDKGFLIDDICERNFVKLIRPPFLRPKKQFSASDALLCKKNCQVSCARRKKHRAKKISALLNLGSHII